MMRSAAIACLVLLAGCQEAEQPSAPPPPALQTAAAPAPDGGKPEYDPNQPGAGNEYSYLDLLELRDGDAKLIGANMQHVGGCSFKDDEGRLLLSVGSPDLKTARGIGAARLNGKGVIRLDATEAGAAYIDAGPTLIHAANTKVPEIKITVTHAQGKGKSAGIETVEWPAQMVVSDPDATRQPYHGTWSCGV